MALTKINGDVIEANAIDSTHLASGAVTTASLTGIDTDAVAEGSTNLYHSAARARSSISVTGGNLSYDSGTGVLQLTTDTIRSAISVTDAGGDGSLAYSAGVITYTGPSASEVRAHFSAGTGINISSGQISTSQDISTTATPTFGNITTTGYIAGPATFTIDPAAVGDNTGTVVIAGNLQVDGTTTTINSTTVNIDDLNIQLATGAINAAAADGAGITVDGASATITYDATNDEWDFNKDINVAGQIKSVQSGGTSFATTGVVSDMSGGSYIVVADPQNVVDNILAGIKFSAFNGDSVIAGTYDSTNNSSIIFGTETSGTITEKMRINSAGKVGIGTATPINILSVNADTPSIDLIHSGTSKASILTGSAGALAFYTGGAYNDGGSERMRIDSSGNVMVGKTSLSVGSDGQEFRSSGIMAVSRTDANPFYVNRNGTDGSLIEFRKANVAFGAISAVGSGKIGYHSVSGNGLTVDSSGNVGIANTSPSYPLDVTGTIRASNGISTDGPAKFYTWRAIQNTGATTNRYFRIARIDSSQSSRFSIELTGRNNSYGNTTLPSWGKLVGQLNNDSNYDLTYYNFYGSTTGSEVVLDVGQVDINTTTTDIYINVATFSEVAATAYISDGTITTYSDNNSASVSAPTGYTSVNEEYSMWHSGNSMVGCTTSSSDPTVSSNPAGGAGSLWINSSSGEAYVCTDATSGENSWVNIGEGTGSIFPPPDIAWLVVGGGGAGTGQYAGGGNGGGGAGGMRTGTHTSVAVGTVLTATVGAGATGVYQFGSAGAPGSDSTLTGSGLQSITSFGGGGGGGSNDSGTDMDGGSGGGGGTYGPGSGTASQGNDGGSAGSGMGGGGGGAGATGSAGATNAPGDGGDGATSSITGTSTYYAGGGGGGGERNGSFTQASGGLGGGGDGGINTNTGNNVPAGGSGDAGQAGRPGTANTGGGGGAGSKASGGSPYGGNGGSGVVILRVKTSLYSGTTTGSPTVTTDGDYTVIKFTGSGTYTA